MHDQHKDKHNLHLVSKADALSTASACGGGDCNWLRQTIENARYGTEELTEEERVWLDRVTARVGGLAQVACRQREVINRAVGDWEADLRQSRRQGWMALLAGVVLGMAIGAALWLAGMAVGQ
jgi:hypothetical protein